MYTTFRPSAASLLPGNITARNTNQQPNVFKPYFFPEIPDSFQKNKKQLKFGAVYELRENQRGTGSFFDPDLYAEDSKIASGNKHYGVTENELTQLIESADAVLNAEDKEAQERAEAADTILRDKLIKKARKAKGLIDTTVLTNRR